LSSGCRNKRRGPGVGPDFFGSDIRRRAHYLEHGRNIFHVEMLSELAHAMAEKLGHAQFDILDDLICIRILRHAFAEAIEILV
jgi:hypothetical protein